ncbi:redoxin domain-containing protein [Chryseobacterium sp. Leaf394]|uniref:TlpA family protein disulfide reductase n=1 Tax=Chryseobacterium sp. Leaf394 TaxID=1736361 RepID=UPI000700D419|nr:redoxin domain-containing protein [Chryseobacterium sp. Leaf394]KQS92275.1 redoxin [Chryseobacterium sp. Leaf394]
MKTIILSAFVLVALSACKKETTNTENNSETEDSISQVVEKPAAKPLPEVSPAKTGDFLAKKNDTLYVTNFFATWCGPCVQEIPHFKKKIEEFKGQPVKITFVSLDQKEVWNSKVPAFTQEHGIENHTVLLDGQLLDQNFFSSNFKEWTGSAIPFTFMRKGDKTVETLGNISEQQLNEKIASLLK